MEFLIPLLGFVHYVLQLVIYVIIASAILSWLVAFNVINLNNQFVHTIWDTLNRLTEPMYRPIRRMLPDMGGIDLSPLVVILVIIFLQSVVINGTIRTLAGLG